jgi:ABC-2 type transport system permease protein
LSIPTLHTQLYFNDLAQTSLTDYIRLLDSATTFHERMRLYFYPRIFANTSVQAEDWSSFRPEYLRERPTVRWLPMILPLMLISALFMVWAWMRRQKLASV